MNKPMFPSERGQGSIEYLLILLVISCAILAFIIFIWRFLDIEQKVVLVFGVLGIIFIIVGARKWVWDYLPQSIKDNIQTERKYIQKQYLPSTPAKTEKNNETILQNLPETRLKRTLEILSYIAGIISCLIASITFLISFTQK
jgi:hypothetical protein